jgi:hypothetical protein
MHLAAKAPRRRRPVSFTLGSAFGFESHHMFFAIKTEVVDAEAKAFVFDRQKTMYEGKRVQAGDTIYVFASENEGGSGLIARGTVTASAPTPRVPGVERQTPRVSISVKRTARSTHRLGRKELRPFSNWSDGRPETELNFKFYRQATNKIAGISEETAAFLDRHFQ